MRYSIRMYKSHYTAELPPEQILKSGKVPEPWTKTRRYQVNMRTGQVLSIEVDETFASFEEAFYFDPSAYRFKGRLYVRDGKDLPEPVEINFRVDAVDYYVLLSQPKATPAAKKPKSPPAQADSSDR